MKSLFFPAIMWLCATIACAAPLKPNIVLIFTDDLGYGDAACFQGSCKFSTPHINQLAQEGARLTQFYVPTPYCAPSRATVLTGRYPFRHGLVSNPNPDAGISNIGLPPSEITIAEMLKKAGYKTAAYGKWHLGHKAKWLPRTQGFDEYYGILYSNDMAPVQLVRNEEVVEYPVVQRTLTKRYTEMTLDFIERNKDQPFFVYLPHAMPHKPLAVSDNFYTPDTLDNLYADVITELDASVGQVMAKLRELSLDDNTLVIFTSDNGPWLGGSTGGLRGMKGLNWEGGLKVPMIARFSGVIPAGVVNDQPAGTIDILPTIASMVGLDLPSDRVIDGADIMPMFKSAKAPSPHEAIYSMKQSKLATIRSDKWKLHVLNPGSATRLNFTRVNEVPAPNWDDPRGPNGVTIIAPVEQPGSNLHPGLIAGAAPSAMMLFDLQKDPGEQINVANKHPDVVKKLKRLFDETNTQIPEFPVPEKEYLFAEPKKGDERILMHLIGGELRYDKVPMHQQHLMIEKAAATSK